MIEKREHKRINCAEKCLVYYADSRYSGAIMNMSISGALVVLNGFAPGNVTPGNTCSLILSNAHETSFCRYKGQITRVDPSGIGVRILAHEF